MDSSIFLSGTDFISSSSGTSSSAFFIGFFSSTFGGAIVSSSTSSGIASISINSDFERSLGNNSFSTILISCFITLSPCGGIANMLPSLFNALPLLLALPVFSSVGHSTFSETSSGTISGATSGSAFFVGSLNTGLKFQMIYDSPATASTPIVPTSPIVVYNQSLQRSPAVPPKGNLLPFIITEAAMLINGKPTNTYLILREMENTLFPKNKLIPTKIG